MSEVTDPARGGGGEHIRVVLFDIGGVLARFSGLTVLQEITGIPSELEVAGRWLASPWVRRFESGACTEQEFAAGLVAEWDLPFSPAQLLEAFPTWLDPPFAGARELVAETRAHAEVGCLSNTNVLAWRTVISDWPVTALFQHRFLSFELGAVKPDRVIYEQVIERLATEPASILFLDDSPLNVEGAIAVGLRAEQAVGVEQARAALARHGLLDLGFDRG